MIVTAGIAGAVLSAIAANLIRLGPSTVDLPPNALVVYAAWFRFPDGDPLYDYYGVQVTVVNNASAPSVYPYAVELNLTVIGGQIMDHRPGAGDSSMQVRLPLTWGGTPPDILLNLPAGSVSVHDAGSYVLWTVAGRRGFSSQPVFTTSGDFYAAFRVHENESLEAHPEVALDWYYASPLQAYSVVVIHRNVVCYHVPGADEEGTAPYGGCS